MVVKILCDLCGEDCTPKGPWDTNEKADAGNSYVNWKGDACSKCGNMFSKNLKEIKEKYIELTHPIQKTIKEQNKNFAEYLTKLAMLDVLE